MNLANKSLLTSDLVALPLRSSVIMYLYKLRVSHTYQCHQQLRFFCLPYPISAHLISFQFFWHRSCDTDACVFFIYFDDAEDMLIHLILIVGNCYTHTATHRAHYIYIFFCLLQLWCVLRFGVVLLSKRNCRMTVAN